MRKIKELLNTALVSVIMLTLCLAMACEGFAYTETGDKDHEDYGFNYSYTFTGDGDYYYRDTWIYLSNGPLSENMAGRILLVTIPEDGTITLDVSAEKNVFLETYIDAAPYTTQIAGDDLIFDTEKPLSYSCRTRILRKGEYRIIVGYSLETSSETVMYYPYGRHDITYKVTFNKLTDTEKKSLDEVKALEVSITALPAEITINDENAVSACKAAYDKLNDEQKQLVGTDYESKLDKAVGVITQLKEKSAEGEKTAEQATTQEEKQTTKIIRTVTINKATVNASVVNKAIAAAGGSKKYVTKIVLGKKVKKISKSAFKGTKATTLVIKTKLLKKSKVTGALKDSKIKTVQVKLGTKKLNRIYVKKYKKIFTKKNVGRKVTVK